MLGVLVASIERTAYPRFKRLVSARELTEAFTPTADEAGWARGRTQTERNLLGLIVLLECYQRLGYFPKLVDVPVAVVDHIRGGLELAEDVTAAYRTLGATASSCEGGSGWCTSR
ncbi:DUF4158 domain-containing protein [Rhodococcus sp. NPDC057014]|uniref:DUF4158 domain-containing protein n=1 Tax=Rhodococcus sp. NPDC057014 TaxID=3346000 RepID=UPI00363CED15